MIVILGVIFLVVYVLWFYCWVVMGDLIKESFKIFKDMIVCEKWIFVLLVVMILILGVYLLLVIDIIGFLVEVLIVNYDIVVVYMVDVVYVGDY